MSCPSRLAGAVLLLVGTLHLSAQNSCFCGYCSGDHSARPDLQIRPPFEPSGPAVLADQVSGFTIALTFNGGLTASQEAIFTDAKVLWEGHLTGYKEGISLSGVNITAQGTPIDGVGGVLGSAGPTWAALEAGYLLTTDGNMDFDTADLASMEADGSLYWVIVHEMAHVLGFGTLWDGPGLGFPGTQDPSLFGSGQFTGVEGLAAWQAEFQPGAGFIPVELEGGAGTVDAHWDEVLNGLGNTGFTDPSGRDLADEVMTGWIGDPNDVYLSNTTVASFGDLGFEFNLAPIPEPSTATLLLLALLTPFIRGTRRPGGTKFS